jgi:hypothetical protein
MARRSDCAASSWAIGGRKKGLWSETSATAILSALALRTGPLRWTFEGHGAASALDREEKPQPAARLILREAQVEGGRRWLRSHQRAVVLRRVKAEPFGWPLKSGQP